MTTNRMGLTPDQSANCFSDDELEMMQHENNPRSHAFRELLAYRKASEEAVCYLTWHQGCRAPDDCEDYVVEAKPGDKSCDGSPAFPVYAAPPLQAGTVPDGWINCSERMPEEGGRYWCYVEEQNSLGKSHYQWNCSWNGDEWSDASLSGRVTHWMPLAAVPRQ